VTPLLDLLSAIEASVKKHGPGYVIDAEDIEDVCALIGVVRELSAALEFYGEPFTWSRVGADAQHMGAEHGFDFNGMYGSKARLALEKAEKILGER
jgi:hypothetical protein